MDKPKLDNKTIKKIIPVKGNLKNNLLKKLKESQSAENGRKDTINNNHSTNVLLEVKEPLKSPENKIIIQKVESVKLEIIKTNPKAHFVPERRISSLFTSNEIQSQSENPSRENAVEKDKSLPEILEKLAPNPLLSTSNPPHSSVTLLSAKIPENSCNKIVPLKMIRTIKGPRPKPNLLPRIHRVETTKSPEPSVVAQAQTFDYSSVRLEILHPDITMTEESQVENNSENNRFSVLVKDPEQIGKSFNGFDHLATIKGSDIGLWKDVLKHVSKEDSMQVIQKTAITESPRKRLKISPSHDPPGPRQRFDIKTIKSPQRFVLKASVKSDNIDSSPEKAKFKISSASKKYLDILSKTEKTQQKSGSMTPKQLISLNNNFPSLETAITAHTQRVSPQKLRLPHVQKNLLKMEVADKVEIKDASVSTSSQSKIDSTLIPSTSKGLSKRKEEPKVKMAHSDWMEDILTVIGSSRIEKIDQSLKEIPNLITGNFSAIETENVEFKLIIKHLLRELGVKSVMETLKFASKNGSMSLSMIKDDDDDDDFDGEESFDDDDSHEPSNFFTEDSNTNDQTFEDDNCRNSSNQPGTSHSLATSFGEVPSFSFQSEPYVLGESLNSPYPQVQKSLPQNEMVKDFNRVDPMVENANIVSIVQVSESLPTEVCSLIECPIIINEVTKPSRPSKRKNEMTSTPPLESSSKKTKTHQRLPWDLLLDGEVRRGSLRSSSRESSTEPATRSPNRPIKKSEKLISEKKDCRRSPRLSSRDSSAEPAKQPKPAQIFKKNVDLVQPTVKTETNRSSPKLSLRESSAEPSKISSLMSKEKSNQNNSKKIKNESDSDGSDVFRRSTRTRPLKPMSDDSNIEETPKSSRNVSQSDDSDEPLVRKITKTKATNKERPKSKRGRKPKNDTTKKMTCKLFENDLAPDNCDNSRKIELKSRLAPLDSISNKKSSILIRNNYLKSSDKRAAKERTEMNSMMEKLKMAIAKKKGNDPTYVEPPVIEKRPRLRTSAFKGTDNDSECSNDEDIQANSVLNTDGPSVSSSRASSTDRSNQSLSLQGLMKKEKQKLIQSSRNKSVTPEKRRGRRRMQDSSPVAKKLFVQEPLEDAIESEVPYFEILQSIKVATVSKKTGRSSLKSNKEDESRRKEYLESLQALKYFRCGSCGFEVTKHKWIEHFLMHGGLAWVDGLENPILLTDWNEALRRTIHAFKIYNQTFLKCPNCTQEKRSALGHLSHILVCGESETAIEDKKVPCAHCNERFLPFYASAHKTKCSGLATIVQKADDGDDEDDQESDDEVSPESLNSSGRKKRKAVKRAEKNFKKILTNLDEASDHLQIVSGKIECHICGETNFVSQKEALEHIKVQHSTSLNGDFEASDSDVSIKAGDSSEETEGSSGVESSDIASNEENEEMSDNDDKIVSSKKARLPTTEPQEVKIGRALMSEYVDTIRNKVLTTKTIHWTQTFIDEHWKAEMLAQLVPRILSEPMQDPKVVLPSHGFNLKSMFFGTQQVENYSSNFGNEYKKEWKQLEIGEHDTNKHSITIHCGGSVSAIDWAPSSSDLNFLAVACNSCSTGIKMNLEQTISSCVQLHEFKNLKNDKFQEFENSSKLCYVFIIEEGPIWSIKFHPSESPLEKRVGLLAVSSANQNVLIYSLPYRNEEKSIILTIAPNFICKLSEADTLFNEKYLLQASRVSWFTKRDGESILAAGYVSGLIAVWNVTDYSEDEESYCLYPHHVIPAHLESVTALDFKPASGSEFHLVTASLDRKIKVFTFDEFRFQEISCHYAVSRPLCAEWWLHWPGYIVGFDDCFTYGSIIQRQPLEFGSRNSPLLAVSSSITHFSINHSLNFVMFVSDSGDVLGCQPGQMLQTYPKDKWSYFKFSMFSSTDFNNITIDGVEKIGVVFSDFKTTTRQPKNYRLASVSRINELLINQVCFNRNEKSYRFYALGFETGFVRIRYLKNSK